MAYRDVVYKANLDEFRVIFELDSRESFCVSSWKTEISDDRAIGTIMAQIQHGLDGKYGVSEMECELKLSRGWFVFMDIRNASGDRTTVPHMTVKARVHKGGALDVELTAIDEISAVIGLPPDACPPFRTPTAPAGQAAVKAAGAGPKDVLMSTRKRARLAMKETEGSSAPRERHP